jgi:hypothetical protein
LIKLAGLALIGSGMFAFFLASTRHFLPHDIAHLGMTANAMESIAQGRLVHFMMHDRVSFGGAIIAVGTLYLWLAEFPLKAGQAWAWWTLVLSGIAGFASFLAYLGYGYLDTWHGAATLVLLPMFVVGLARSRDRVKPLPPLRLAFRPVTIESWRTPFGFGRLMLLVTSLALVLGGLIILTVGMTTVFVPQDLEFMGVDASTIAAANERLIPLIAHDRAGFGGGVCCCGLTMFCCVLCGQPSRSLWQALLISGLAGFGTAIGVHYPIGYLSFSHLLPAYLGATMFLMGIVLTYPRMVHN